EQAWSRLVHTYTPRIFALCRSRLRRDDLAEEVTQSVFATIAAKLGSGRYNEQGRFESWLFRIAMNRVRDEARRLKRHATPTDAQQFADHVETRLTENRPAVEQLSALREALATLKPADREVVELRHHGGLSFAQIAEMLEQPMGTVLARHHRALAKLRSKLGEQQSDNEAGHGEGKG
ncbi:MAG: sigma-70 family RNA polymerase sigma factor, partial [Planctomycetota bacterium]